VGYYEKKKQELQDLLELVHRQKAALEASINYLKSSSDSKDFISFEAQMQKDQEAVARMAKERQLGFPWLAKAYDDYFELQERGITNYLQQKSQPAIKTATIVREYSRLRREAERRARVAEYLVAYYEHIAPFLIELREEVEDAVGNAQRLEQEYSEEELEDNVTGYLTKEEYHKLSATDRNQLALDRFWSRPKSKWLVGRMYERYIGYLFESSGYTVEYCGIFQGLET
jgi:hypothetical protein